MKFVKIIGLIVIILICVKAVLYFYNNYAQKVVLQQAPVVGEATKNNTGMTLDSSVSIAPSLGGNFDMISSTSSLSNFKNEYSSANYFKDSKGNLYVIQNQDTLYKVDGKNSTLIFKPKEEINNILIENVAGQLYLISDAVYIVDGANLVKIGPRTDRYMWLFANKTNNQVYVIGHTELSIFSNLFFIDANNQMNKIGKFSRLFDYAATSKGLLFSSENQLYVFKDNTIGKINVEGINQQIIHPAFYENESGIYMTLNNSKDIYKVVIN